MNSTSFKEHLEQLFAECDVDQNGSLGRDEFIELCSKIGLNKEAAVKTFDRLDTDRNDRITFDEFTAGFNQYKQLLDPVPLSQKSTSNAETTTQKSGQKLHAFTENSDAETTSPVAIGLNDSIATGSRPVSQSSTPKSSRSPATQRRSNKPQQTLNPNSVAARGRKSASPIGVMSLGSTTSSSGTSSGANMRRCTSGSAGYSTDSTDLVRFGGNSQEVLQSSGTENNNYYSNGTPMQNYTSTAKSPTVDPGVVVYSSEAIGYSGDQANGSGQFGSTISSSGSFNQLCNMQDLLDCVQKLQNENQILTQIFFKDKREREEYISQLGEEFDAQLREVEERANKRAREELENEKKRLRDMMKTERETLEHHYQTIEKMSRMLKNPNGKLDPDGETIEKVRTKLEDTFVENRQLKRSLLDTKTDVAMIWKEMEKLKRQYENKLSSAYEKHNETKSECDHIKQQLNLMKDSNRKLQDASDVITNYITDKVEPVIKVASGVDDALIGSGHVSLDGSNRLGISSQSNSRRGSILSDYLNSGSIDSSGDLESMASSRNDNFRRTASTSNLKGPGGSAGGLEPINMSSASTSPMDSNRRARLNPLMHLQGGKSDAEDSISEKSATGAPTKLNKDDKNVAPQAVKEQQNDALEDRDSITQLISKQRSSETNPTNGKPSLGIKKIGRHFFIGSRTQSDVKTEAENARNSSDGINNTKSKSMDQANECFVGPADGQSQATFNIILVGDSFVGKSSFAARFVEGNFVQGLISNCSIDFKTKAFKVDNVNYTVNLWDTAGQERFRSLTASYFRKADGIILMYDVTDRRTYLNVRNWMATISDTATENVAVLLVGNKVDLRTKENKASCVPTEEGFRLAREYDIVFLETSVKTGTNLLPSLGQLIRLIAKNNETVEEDEDKIRLNDKSKTFNCMPKSC